MPTECQDCCCTNRLPTSALQSLRRVAGLQHQLFEGLQGAMELGIAIQVACKGCILLHRKEHHPSATDVKTDLELVVAVPSNALPEHVLVKAQIRAACTGHCNGPLMCFQYHHVLQILCRRAQLCIPDDCTLRSVERGASSTDAPEQLQLIDARPDQHATAHARYPAAPRTF